MKPRGFKPGAIGLGFGKIPRIKRLGVDAPIAQGRIKALPHTGDIAGAGTDAKVYVNIMGSKGPSGEKHLNNPHKDDFEKGNTDTFHVDCRCAFGASTVI